MQHEEKFESHLCANGCCNFKIKPYPIERLKQNYSSGSGLRKAGSFVYDSSANKILLVQSRGLMWGPPKGSMNPNESPTECAIREVREETGLHLDPDSLRRSIVVKSKALFFLTDMKECEVQPQTDMDDNDANGIGWFHIDCLQDLVQSGLMSINNPCRILIRKVFGKEISFNQDSFIPVRRSPSRHYRGAQKEQDDQPR